MAPSPVSTPLASLTPLAGGHSGRTFVGEAGGERVVVRLYPPGPGADHAPETDAALLALVRGLLPVADVLEVRRGDAASGQPGLLVTSWLPGERGDLVVDELDDEDRLARLGAAMGLWRPLLRECRCATRDRSSTPSSPWGASPRAGWWSGSSRAWVRGPTAIGSASVRVAAPAQDLLDAADRACLVHSDLNPKNVLVDPLTGELTGLVDWEFAHAGHPWTDLGNVLRFDRHETYVRAALDAWVEVRGGTADAVLDGARAADLWALVDLAARSGENPVATRAEGLLRTIAATGDLHAWPSAP